jgi:hypothetical protein
MNRDAKGHRVVRLRTLLVAVVSALALVVVLTLWNWQSLRQQVRALLLGNMELAAERYGWELAQRVDSLEIYEIEEASRATNSVSIHIGGRTETHGYVAKRELNEAEAKVFMEHWGRMRFHWGLSGLCHFPAFVVRFLEDAEPKLETTLCFECHNFQIPDFFGERTFMGFEQKSPKGQAFVAHVESLFPDSPKWVALQEMEKKQGEQKE